jgi:hypothetical protein
VGIDNECLRINLMRVPQMVGCTSIAADYDPGGSSAEDKGEDRREGSLHIPSLFCKDARLT